jgi:hypothetical protein
MILLISAIIYLNLSNAHLATLSTHSSLNHYLFVITVYFIHHKVDSISIFIEQPRHSKLIIKAVYSIDILLVSGDSAVSRQSIEKTEY